MCSKMQKDTSGSIIIMDEKNDDDERHTYRNTTGTPKGDKKSNPQYAAWIVENKFR